MMKYNALSRADLSPEQIKNLDKLATYLEKLPENYDHFRMAHFLCMGVGPISIEKEIALFEKEKHYALHNGGLDSISCGTVACAVGHGPAAGVPVPKKLIDDNYYNVDWLVYSELFAPENSSLWSFLFSGVWSKYDNTHRGAAARIRYILDGGDLDKTPDMFLPHIYEKYLLKGN